MTRHENWRIESQPKSLSKVKRRSNDKEAIKEGEVSYEVEYTDRVTGALVSGAVSVLVKIRRIDNPYLKD